MRKIVLDLAVSLDGFIEGPNGEIDWCILEEDMDLPGFLSGIDTIFYGRDCYEQWGNFQPDPNSDEAEKQVWDAVRSKKKYVFSRNTNLKVKDTLVTTEVAKTARELRQQEGKDIWLYGGAKLITTFLKLGLIDVYRISVHPTVLGSGKPLFEDLKERFHLNLIEVNRFRSGVVQLIYVNRDDTEIGRK